MPDAVGAAGRPDAVTAPLIRRFDDAAIGRAIDQAIAREMPEGHTVAVVAAIDNRDGIHRQRLVAVAKIGTEWSIMGTLEHQSGKRLEYGAAVRWSM